MSTEESKKRRWDQNEATEEHSTLPTKMAATSIDSEQPESASGVHEPADDLQSQQACSEPMPEQESCAHMPPPVSETSRELDTPAEFTANIDINDSDNRQVLAKQNTHVAIIEATGVEIATRGRHYADASEATPADPALHLHVEASSQEILDKAIGMIETMKSEDSAVPHPASISNGNDVFSADYAHSDNQPSGRQSSASGTLQRLQDKVYIEVESVRGFNVRAKVIGTGGENMKYIQNTTGARVQVRGSGSGCDDGAPGSDPYEPMHLYITATSEDALNQAKGYCASLVETLHAQYHEFKDMSGRRYESSSSYRDSRDRDSERDRDTYQSSRHRGDRHHYDRSQQSYYPSRQEYPPRQEYQPRHEYPQSYPQQGYSQLHHQPMPSAATDTAAYEEYAKYYAEYYQYYGTYPDPSAYYGQAEHGTTHPAYPVPEHYPQGTYSQNQLQYPSASVANTNSHYDEASPGNASSHQNGYHNVPPPTDYSNKKV